MDIKHLGKKAQGLPLNTIVLAILVVIVLLVIITFFTSSVAESGESIEQNSVSQCSESNPALATLGYTEFKVINTDGGNSETCKDDAGEDFKAAVGISNCCVKK